MTWPSDTANDQLNEIIALATAANRYDVVAKAQACKGHDEDYPTKELHEAWVALALFRARTATQTGDPAEWGRCIDALDHVGGGDGGLDSLLSELETLAGEGDHAEHLAEVKELRAVATRAEETLRRLRSDLQSVVEGLKAGQKDAGDPWASALEGLRKLTDELKDES